MVTAALGLCALCATAATVTDWTPIQSWVAVEGCLCGGFFRQHDLWDRVHVAPRFASRSMWCRTASSLERV